MNLFGDPYNLQDAGVSLQGEGASLKGEVSPQQVYVPTPSVQPRGAQPTTQTTQAKPVVNIAPRTVAVPPHIASRDTQINSIFSPYIDSRPSASNPGVLEYYNKQTGQGFSSAQDLYNFASTLGAGQINSFDQLHAPINYGGGQTYQPSFNPQVQDVQLANQNQTTAQQAGYANLSPDEYIKLVQQQNQLTPDEIAQIRSRLGIDQLEQQVFQPPSKSTEQVYTDAYNAANLGDIKSKIMALNDQINTINNQFTDAQANVNENPFLSEASRVGRISILQDKAQQKISNLLNYQKQYQDLYQQGLNEVNGLVTRHTNDFTLQQSLNQQKLTYLLSKAEQQAAATVAQKNEAAYSYLPDYLKAKVKGQNPQTVTAPNGAIFNYNRSTGTFDMIQPPNGNVQYNPYTDSYYSQNTGQVINGGSGSVGMTGGSFPAGAQTPGSAAAVNNPLGIKPNGVFAKYATPDDGFQAGVQLIQRYQSGSGPKGINANSTLDQMVKTWITGNPNSTQKTGYNSSNVAQYLQQLGVQATPNTPIGQIDSVALAAAIGHFETGFTPGSAGGQSGNLIDSTAQQLVNGQIDPDTVQQKPNAQLIFQRADQLSRQQKGVPFNAAVASQIFKANSNALNNAIAKQASITAAHQKLLGDLQQIAQLADKVNTQGIPDLDAFINGQTSKYSNNPDLVQFKHLITTARGDYAIINAGGGTADDKNQAIAADAIPANGNSAVYQRLIQSADSEAQRQIAALNAVISQYSGNGSSSNANSNKPPLSSYNL